MSPRKHLRHLTAWRTFEAAARHTSFVLAAEELSVTPAAISQQIKQLEGYLGVQLFIRTRRGVHLTKTASAILPELSDAFDQLNRTIARFRRRQPGNVITVTVPPSLAMKWLMSRLEGFRTMHPDIDVRIDTTDRLVDFQEEDIDIGLRYGAGNYPGLETEVLLVEELLPVCTPEFARRMGTDISVERIAEATLIHDATIRFDDTYPTWKTWFRHTGGRDFDLDTSRSLHVNSTLLAVEAAINNQGVLLGRSVIIDEDLKKGRLVRLFDGSGMKGLAYHVVYLPGALEQPRIRYFRDWLVAQTKSLTELDG